MLETEQEIRNFVLEKLAKVESYKISNINCLCKNEATLFSTLEHMVENGEIGKDNVYVWLPLPI